jgi:O-antigen/teichoic acid export membrane protein
VISNKRLIIVNYFGSAWMALMAVAFVPVYIHYLGIEAYALVGLFTVIQSWASLLDAGMTPTLSREMARYSAGQVAAQTIRDLTYTMEFVYGGIIAVAAIALVIAAPWAAVHWVHAQKLPTATIAGTLQIIGLVVGLRWMSGLYRGAFIGLQRQIWLNMTATVFATLRGLGTVCILAWISPTITAFFWFQGLLAMLEVLVLATYLRRVLPVSPSPARFDVARLREVWRFAAGMSVLVVLSVLLTQFDKLVLSKVLSLSDFGYYAVASSVANGIYIVLTPITNVSYPRFTETVSRGDTAGLAALYHKFAQLTAVMVVPASLVLAFFSRDVLLIWTRDATITDVVAPLVSLLVIGNMLHGLMHTSYTLQLAYGRTALNIVANTIAVVVLLPTLYLAVTRYGAVAAPIVWIILNLAYLTVVTPLVHRELLTSEMSKWYRSDVVAPIAATLAAVGSLWAISPPASLDHPLATCAIVFAAAVLGFAAAAVSVEVGREEMATRFRQTLLKVR